MQKKALQKQLAAFIVLKQSWYVDCKRIYLPQESNSCRTDSDGVLLPCLIRFSNDRAKGSIV